MLLFYLSTGWYQSLNTNRAKTEGEIGDWVSKLTSIHVDLIFPGDKAETFSSTFHQFLINGMCIALLASVFLGLYPVFKVVRPKWALWVTSGLGVIIPALALRHGNQH
jgi:hypothetical protein